jgi:hypothetical protein
MMSSWNILRILSNHCRKKYTLEVVDVRRSSLFNKKQPFMLKKNTINFLIALIVCVIFLLIGSALYSIDDIIILPKVGHLERPVAFTHGLHSKNYGLKCIDCHHTGKKIKCSSCHLRQDQVAIINIKGAYHQQCLGCHRKISGPLGCSRCHKVVR